MAGKRRLVVVLISGSENSFWVGIPYCCFGGKSMTMNE